MLMKFRKTVFIAPASPSGPRGLPLVVVFRRYGSRQWHLLAGGSPFGSGSSDRNAKVAGKAVAGSPHPGGREPHVPRGRHRDRLARGERLVFPRALRGP